MEENTAAPDSAIKNVLVIILDALRADHLGIYGYHRNTSPNIDALARKGLVFDRAIVQAGWTKPSVTSYFTSLYPNLHGVLFSEENFPENLTTLAEVFRQNGYSTYGLIHNVHISPSHGFGQGFDVYRKISDEQIINDLWLIMNGRYLALEQLDGKEKEELGRVILTNPEWNLVTGSGFETPDKAWSGESWWRERGTAHSGHYATRITRKSFPHSNFYHLRQKIGLDYGENYLFGAFVKTRDLKGEVGISLYEPGARQYKYVSTDRISGTNDWTLLLENYRPQSSDGLNRTEVQIRAGRVTDFQGSEFWIDDVFVIPVGNLPPFRPADRLFIYAHFLDPHAPYLPPRDYLNLFAGTGEAALIDKYDGEIRAQDTRLGLLFESMEAAGLLDQTLIIITSDHGEEFGDHGYWRHGPKFFHEEVARIPLIYHHPGLFPKPERRDEPVEASVDLLPSLIDLLDLSVPEGNAFRGKSYFDESGSRSPLAYLYETPHDRIFRQVYLKTVTDGKWKYITNEYRDRVEETEILGVWRDDGGVEVTVTTTAGEDKAVYADIQALQDSDFFQKLDRDVQFAVHNVYLAASGPKGREAMLYNLEEDPGEKNNLIEINPEKARELQLLIEDRIEADRNFQSRVKVTSGGKMELNDQVRKELRALGYLQ
ncbi:MAG: sulfatase [Candidatus Erginobacter occultus]|nr:sulfatase [Candidatus Erginobacter occultus]